MIVGDLVIVIFMCVPLCVCVSRIRVFYSLPEITSTHNNGYGIFSGLCMSLLSVQTDFFHALLEKLSLCC